MIQPPIAQLALPATNSSQFFRLRSSPVPGPGSVVPPQQSAPPPPPNVVWEFANSVAFLYSGTNATQVGVVPGAIDSAQISVARGKVTKRDGTPLPGVRVSVLNHPEYGFTYTRADGAFDLALNAAWVVLDFQLRGYTAAQRPVNAPLGDYVFADPVALVGIDPVATAVSFGSNAPAQMATSSVQTDTDGTRSATVVFPVSTHATMVLPNGTTQDCRGLTIRATEYTVGPNGPAAMPAPLPPSSAYTYCVALTADEGTSAGARTINFDQPVFAYVDNFLGFDTGTLVPSGYYDRQAAVWVPQPNGIVVQIVAISNGVAQVDMDGDGVPESLDFLSANQFTIDELALLATRYPVGHSLWRVPISHFTDWDFNMDVDPVDGKPRKPGDRPYREPSDNKGGNGDLNLQSRIFTEHIPLQGVPMSLHYSSARVPDYRLESTAIIPLTDTNPVSGLQGIELTMDIAGQHLSSNFPPQLNLSTEMDWNGLDAYGRQICGSRMANFTLYYYFPVHYKVAGGGPARAGTVYAGTPSLFGNYGGYATSQVHRGAQSATSVSFSRPLTIPDHRVLGLGAWSLTPLHRYDPVGRLLYLGDGRIRQLTADAAGGATPLVFPNRRVSRIAAAPDGSLLMVIQYYQGSAQLFRFRNGGSPQALFAGSQGPGIIALNGEDWTPADGQPAITVLPGAAIEDIAAGPDGSVYVRTFRTIGRIDPRGIFHLLVGSGPWPPTLPPDGTPGRNAWAEGDGTGHHLAVGPDGSVFFTAGYSVNGQQTNLLQKLATDGRIYTIAGLGGWQGQPYQSWRWEIGKPALQARLEWMEDIAVGPDGSVYVSGGGSGGIYRVTPGGILQAVLQGTLYSPAGLLTDPRNRNDEGRPAVSTGDTFTGGNPDSHSVRVGPDGTVYFYQAQISNPALVWKITPNGILQRVAGRFSPPDNPAHTPDEDVSPLETAYSEIIDLALDHNGGLVLVDAEPNVNSAIRQYGATQIRLGTSSILIPSEDTTELYEFNAGGQHLRTFDTTLGTTNWTFTYDQNNLISEARDVNGLVTRIQRDSSGKPLAIVGPYGETTTLTLDANGFLASVTSPAGDSTRCANSPGGLLTSITGPRGFTFQFDYDAKGRVSAILDPAGGLQTVSGDEQPDVITVDYTFGGVTTHREMRNLPDGSELIRKTDPNSTTTVTTRFPGQNSSTLLPRGDTLSITYGADPRFPKNPAVPKEGSLSLVSSVSNSVLGTSLGSQLTRQRTVVLSDTNDPLSLVSLTDAMVWDGQNYSALYTASNRTGMATSPEGRRVVTTFDAVGRPVQRSAPGRATLKFSYDAQGRLSGLAQDLSFGTRSMAFSYDSLGRLSAMTDPLGGANRFTYDGADRLVALALPDASLVTFTNDAELNVTAVVPPGRPAHRFQFNAVNLETNYTHLPSWADSTIPWGTLTTLTASSVPCICPTARLWASATRPAGWIRSRWALVRSSP